MNKSPLTKIEVDGEEYVIEQTSSVPVNTKETKHTPGPWETVVIDPRFVFVGPVNKELRDSQGICEFLGEDKQANAEFIVKACNCHDALLEALKKVKTCSASLNSDVLDLVKDAIAKAEGEES